MEYCKGCGSMELTKNGMTQEGVQRYKCKSCGSTFRAGDQRLKYSIEKRIKVIKMHLDGIPIRSIERLEGISNSLIIYWIRNFSAIIRKEIRRQHIPDKLEEIEIFEVEGAFLYGSRKRAKFESGLLSTATGTKLLLSRG